MKGCLVLALLLLGAGCSEGPSKTPTPEAAAKELRKNATPTSPARQDLDLAAKALAEKKYDQAFYALTSAQAKNLTTEESLAVRGAMQSLQQSLAEGIVAGDSNALKTVQLMRQIRPQ